MKRSLFGLIVLCLSLSAQAQSVPATASVSWTPPTQNTDNTPIPATGPTAIVKYQIFAETVTIPNAFAGPPKVETPPGAIAGTVTMTVANNTTIFIRMKACNSALCSDFSNETTKVVTIPKPGVPTSVTFTIAIMP